MFRHPRVLAVTIVTLLAAGLSGAGVHAAGKLRIACNDFPPHKIETPGPDGRLGFDVDIISEALQRAGWSVNILYLPWKRALELAMRGEVDGLCSCSYVKEREQTLLFSKELGAVSVGLFARDTAALNGIDDIADLKGRKVAVVGGYNLEGELEKAGALVQATSTDKNALDMLVGGNIDLLYGYELPTRHFMGAEAQEITLEYREMHRNAYYFCVTRALSDAEQVMSDFNQGLTDMGQDGAIARILERYGVKFR
jgi:polar amino acid transport system substrate-binding protein